jgi:ABC-type amino acid transport substrate-binding protein
VLPQYDFEFKVLDFSAILVGLETGKVDLAAHQFESNADRRARFLYATEGVTRYDQRITVKDGRTDINSLEDLARIGATVQVGSASTNNTYIINKWNTEHGNRLKTVLAPEDPLVAVQNIASGRIDAFIGIERTTVDYKTAYGAKLKVVGQPLSLSNAYYLYRKNDQASLKLKQDVDGALAKLKDNGTLKRLSIKWLGADFIPPKGQ